MASISNKSFKISVQMRPMPLPDSKEAPLIPKIKVKEIAPYLREYEKRCKANPHLKGRTAEINLLKNLLGRYQDPDDVLTDIDFDMLKLICQCNFEKQPPKGMEKLNDWLFKQIVIDLNLGTEVYTSHLFSI